MADDEPDAIFLLRRAFDKAGIVNPVRIVKDGSQAIQYLKGEGEFAQRVEHPLPWLLLLDIKMPRANGFEVLRWIRSQPELYGMRVVMLTASDQMKDLSRAYQFGADSFLVKPVHVADLMNLVIVFRGQWQFGSTPGNPTAGPLPSETS